MSLVQSDSLAPVRTITMASPGTRNALSRHLMAALKAEILLASTEVGVKAIVLAAEGPVYSAGHDLKELQAARAEGDGGATTYKAVFDECTRLMLAIIKCPVPVVAQVQGMATAAGCQLVATCDLAVAAETAQFATPGVNIGLFCSTPMVALSRNVARKHAMKMLLTGEAVSAKTAKKIGLVNKVTAPKHLETKTRKLADVIAGKPRSIVKLGKEAFYKQLEHGLEDAYAYTSQIMAENMMMADAKEGIGAFTEKREPKWSDE